MVWEYNNPISTDDQAYCVKRDDNPETQVHRAYRYGKDFPAFTDGARYAFACECGSVEGGSFIQHFSIQRNTFSGFYFDDVARLYVAGRCDNGLITFDDRCRFRTYVNQCADISLCLAHRPFLK